MQEMVRLLRIACMLVILYDDGALGVDVCATAPASCRARNYHDEVACAANSRRGKVVLIKGGTFKMGTTDLGYSEGEYPERLVYLNNFYLDETPVTNVDYALYVQCTRPKSSNRSSLLFAGQLNRDFQTDAELVSRLEPHFMYEIKGISWERPNLNSSWDEVPNHPVVHVTWGDAKLYCEWVGMRLPTEAEWEYACRAGRDGKNFPWGNKLTTYNRPKENSTMRVLHRSNVWQGLFPVTNDTQDGFKWTSPVKTYPPSAFGLYDMTGNVWEWVSDHWVTKHPEGPLYNPRAPDSVRGEVTMKGGSHLCPNVDCCRCASRRGALLSYSSSDVGFRCAKTAYA